jgi:hypothetical protein
LHALAFATTQCQFYIRRPCNPCKPISRHGSKALPPSCRQQNPMMQYRFAVHLTHQHVHTRAFSGTAIT